MGIGDRNAARSRLRTSVPADLRFRPPTADTAHFIQRVGSSAYPPLPVGAEGTTTSAITGSTTQFLAGVGLAQTGTVPFLAISGASSVTLQDVTPSQAGVVVGGITGTASVSLDAVSISQDGTVSGLATIVGTSSVALAAVSPSADGLVYTAGSQAQTLADVSVSQSGTVSAYTGPITGASTKALASCASVASGAVRGSISSVKLSDIGTTYTGLTNVFISGVQAGALADVQTQHVGMSGIAALRQDTTLAGITSGQSGKAVCSGSHAVTLGQISTATLGNAFASGSSQINLAGVSGYSFSVVGEKIASDGEISSVFTAIIAQSIKTESKPLRVYQ